MTSVVAGFFTTDLIGVIDREVSVTLAEISRKGCLLKSSSAIPAGTIAVLRIEIGGRTYSDDVRVARCVSLPGAGSRHDVGVEFLALRRPGRDSLRMYAASLGEDGLDAESPEVHLEQRR